jgi:hypothetical protein
MESVHGRTSLFAAGRKLSGRRPAAGTGKGSERVTHQLEEIEREIAPLLPL